MATAEISAEDRAVTLCDLFDRTVRTSPDAVALRDVDTGETFTYRQYHDEVADVAAALYECGVRRSDVVAMMFDNRPAFHIVDAAVMHLGATTCSIYNTSPAKDIAHIIASSGARIALCENGFTSRLHDAVPELRVVCTDDEATGVEVLRKLLRAVDFDFEETWRSVEPDDVLTLIYTSGTTGLSKPVEQTHRAMLAEIALSAEALEFRQSDRVPSALPMAHAAQRWGTHYSGMAFGLEVLCIDDISKLVAALIEYQPELWGTVPRVLEKMVGAVQVRLDSEPDQDKRALASAAVEVGHRHATSVQNARTGGAGPSAELDFERARVEPVLAAIRASLGLRNLRWLMVGAAPTPPHILAYLAALGVEVVEVWGMSELSAVATVNAVGQQRNGTVGRPLRDVEILIADDGEILVRGPILMRGYRGNPDATAEALTSDGFLKTGDIGQLDQDGYLKITGRKKEIIINASGKNIAPAKVEGALKSASPLISSAVAIGDSRPFLTALLVLDPEALATFAAAHELPDNDLEYLLHHDKVHDAIAAAVTKANSQLARVEQVKRHTIVPAFWLPGGAELTPTLKVKRRIVVDKYHEAIAAMYAPAEASR